MDFVFVSLQRINTDRESTSTSLAKELAKNHRVLYVNPPIDRKAWIFKPADTFVDKHIELIKQNKAGLKKDVNQLWVLTPKKIIESINWVPFTSMFLFLNKINNRTFASEIAEAILELGFKDFTIINDKDIFRSFYLKELLTPKLYVYLDRDYTIGFEYWQRHGVKLEPMLMKKSDAVVCNSTEFMQAAKKHNPSSFYIANGADLKLFDANIFWAEPSELKLLERPLIGYVGALTSKRLDLPLLIKISKTLETGTLVLLGPQDDDFEQSELQQLHNVQFIEKKDTTVIPGYVKHFDVCINPQLINEITIGNFPLKIIEYLSMGKPVVATATNTMKDVFADHVYLSDTHTEFITLIEKATEDKEDSVKVRRIEFSKKFSWKNVAEDLLNAINLSASNHGPGLNEELI